MASRGKSIQSILKKELNKEINLRKLKQSQLQQIGDLMVDEIKKRVAKGSSPIGAGDRFPEYKNAEKKGYPKDKWTKKKYPSKRARPVNLWLSGDFMNSLKAVAKRGFKPTITIGFFDKKSILKEKGHREGYRGQPKRPIIPLRSESFARQLRRKFLNSVQKALNSIF